MNLYFNSCRLLIPFQVSKIPSLYNRRQLYSIPRADNQLWHDNTSHNPRHAIIPGRRRNNVFILPSLNCPAVLHYQLEPRFDRPERPLRRVPLAEWWTIDGLHLLNPVTFFEENPTVDSIAVRYWPAVELRQPTNTSVHQEDDYPLRLIIRRCELTHEVALIIRDSQTDWYNEQNYYPPHYRQFNNLPRLEIITQHSEVVWA